MWSIASGTEKITIKQIQSQDKTTYKLNESNIEMRKKQTRYLQDDSEIRTKKLGRAKSQTLNYKLDQAQLKKNWRQNYNKS